jgi:extradiol dioxygenase family protein
MAESLSRRDLLRGAASLSAAAGLSRVAAAAPALPRRMADAGWCWDGQSTYVPSLSIFGAGEGTKWFGLRRCCFMYHPNTALAMDKLREMEEVVCEISKWECATVEIPGLQGAPAVQHRLDGRIQRKRREAEMVSQLSLKYPNITGAIDDDLYGKIVTEHISPDQYAAVHRALRSANPKLKHWGVVYSHELKKESWSGFTDLLDVVTLWIWESKDLVNLDRYVEECRAIFPSKPINLGCYLRDYTLKAGVPMERLRLQWEFVRRALADGRMQGYSILAGCLIEMHPQEATWVRDFIRAN